MSAVGVMLHCTELRSGTRLLVTRKRIWKVYEGLWDCENMLRNSLKAFGSPNPQHKGECLLMGTLVTRAASYIIDTARELICSPITTPPPPQV